MIAFQRNDLGRPIWDMDSEFSGARRGHYSASLPQLNVRCGTARPMARRGRPPDYRRWCCAASGSTCLNPAGTSNFEGSTGVDENPPISTVITMSDPDASPEPCAVLPSSAESSFFLRPNLPPSSEPSEGLSACWSCCCCAAGCPPCGCPSA